MINRLLVLVGVTALSGLVSVVGVVGCSNDEAPVVPDSGAADAPTEIVAADAPTEIVPGDDGGPADDTPKCLQPLGGNQLNIKGSQYAYQPAGPKRANACTNQQINDIVAAVQKQTGQFDFGKDIAPKIGDDAGTCAACVEGSDTEWRVFNNNSAWLYNLAGCLETTGAVGETCAAEYYEMITCRSYVCSSCSTQSELDACRDYAMKNDCKYIDVSACKFIVDGEDFAQFEAKSGCGTAFDIISASCGP